ncbi:hypothetical protein ACSN7O_004778 [Enterobacter chuandaensis]
MVIFRPAADQGDTGKLNIVDTRISPIAWQHILLNGHYTFQSSEDLQFYLPQSLRHQPVRIVEVDGLAFLSVLGDGAFCIDPRRWHRIKTYIAKSTVEYPQVSVRDSGVSDGRHRTLLLMQLYNRRTIPVVVPQSHYETFMAEAKNMGAI